MENNKLACFYPCCYDKHPDRKAAQEREGSSANNYKLQSIISGRTQAARQATPTAKSTVNTHILIVCSQLTSSLHCLQASAWGMVLPAW